MAPRRTRDNSKMDTVANPKEALSAYNCRNYRNAYHRPAWPSRIARMSRFMNTKIDIKSAVIGLAVGALVTLGVAATTSSGSSIGRYQVVSNVNNGGQGGSHSLILDTLTGKVWMGYLPSSGKTDDDFFQPKSGEK